MPNQFTASLWGDEAFSAVLSQNSILQIISIIARDTSPPLYNLIEHFWFLIFGSSEVAIRSLSFLFFLIAVFFIYKIGVKLWNRETALIAAILTFLNPFFFGYAFEGRMYSILAATVTGSMYFFLKRNWKGYIIATTLALYSHHFAIFAVFLQGLWTIKEFLFGNRKSAISGFKSLVLIGILYLPWAIPLYNQTKLVQGGFWLGTPTLIDLRNLIYKYLAVGQNHPLSQSALYLAGAILILRKWHKDFAKTSFLLLWFFGPILITFAISQKFTPIFYDRYLLYSIPPAMLILASSRRQIGKLALLVLIGAFAIIDIFYFTHPVKPPFRDLANYVLSLKRGDDLLINWNSASHHLWESYYYHIPAPIYVSGRQNLPYFAGTAQMTDKDIIRTLPQGSKAADPFRIGVITSGSIADVAIPGYTRGETKEFGQLKFLWFQK